MSNTEAQFSVLRQTADPAVVDAISQLIAKGEDRDLNRINGCAASKQKQPDYYRCFVSDDESGGMVAPKRNKSGRAKR